MMYESDDGASITSNTMKHRGRGNGFTDADLGLDMLANEEKMEHSLNVVDVGDMDVNINEPTTPPIDVEDDQQFRRQPSNRPQPPPQQRSAPSPQPVHPFLDSDDDDGDSAISLQHDQEYVRQNTEYRNSNGGGYGGGNNGGGGYEEPEPEYDVQEMRRLKFRAISKLRSYEKKGMPLSRQFTMDDSYEDINEELKIIKSTYQMDRNITYAKKGLVFVTSVAEYANETYRPFDLYLKGWSNQIEMDKDDYDDVIRELLEKYEDQVEAFMSPEFMFLLMYGGSAAAVNSSNKDVMVREEKEKERLAPTPSQPQHRHQQSNVGGQQMPPMGINVTPPMRMPDTKNYNRNDTTGDPDIDDLIVDLP